MASISADPAESAVTQSVSSSVPLATHSEDEDALIDARGRRGEKRKMTATTTSAKRIPKISNRGHGQLLQLLQQEQQRNTAPSQAAGLALPDMVRQGQDLVHQLSEQLHVVHSRVQAVQRRKEELYSAGMKQDKLRPLIGTHLESLELEQQKMLNYYYNLQQQYQACYTQLHLQGNPGVGLSPGIGMPDMGMPNMAFALAQQQFLPQFPMDASKKPEDMMLPSLMQGAHPVPPVPMPDKSNHATSSSSEQDKVLDQLPGSPMQGIAPPGMADLMGSVPHNLLLPNVSGAAAMGFPTPTMPSPEDMKGAVLPYGNPYGAPGLKPPMPQLDFASPLGYPFSYLGPSPESHTGEPDMDSTPALMSRRTRSCGPRHNAREKTAERDKKRMQEIMAAGNHQAIQNHVSVVRVPINQNPMSTHPDDSDPKQKEDVPPLGIDSLLNPQEKYSDAQEVGDEGMDSTVDNSDAKIGSLEPPAPTFYGLRFFIFGYNFDEEKEMREKIQLHEGTFETQYGPVVTHMIAKIESKETKKAEADGKIVCTRQWLKACIAKRHLLSVSLEIPSHVPLPSAEPVPGFADLNVSVTGWSDKPNRWMRFDTQYLIQGLGARMHPTLSREVDILVAQDGIETDKLTKAFQWNLCVVSHEWIFRCVREWKMVNMTPYVRRPPKNAQPYPGGDEEVTHAHLQMDPSASEPQPQDAMGDPTGGSAHPAAAAGGVPGYPGMKNASFGSASGIAGMPGVVAPPPVPGGVAPAGMMGFPWSMVMPNMKAEGMIAGVVDGGAEGFDMISGMSKAVNPQLLAHLQEQIARGDPEAVAAMNRLMPMMGPMGMQLPPHYTGKDAESLKAMAGGAVLSPSMQAMDMPAGNLHGVPLYPQVPRNEPNGQPSDSGMQQFTDGLPNQGRILTSMPSYPQPSSSSSATMQNFSDAAHKSCEGDALWDEGLK